MGSQIFKIAAMFYFGSDKERFERSFLISNVPADNLTPYHGQHVVSELRVNRVWLLVTVTYATRQPAHNSFCGGP